MLLLYSATDTTSFVLILKRETNIGLQTQPEMCLVVQMSYVIVRPIIYRNFTTS
jgi:hypothetical protein